MAISCDAGCPPPRHKLGCKFAGEKFSYEQVVDEFTYAQQQQSALENYVLDLKGSSLPDLSHIQYRLVYDTGKNGITTGTPVQVLK